MGQVTGFGSVVLGMVLLTAGGFAEPGQTPGANHTRHITGKLIGISPNEKQITLHVGEGQRTFTVEPGKVTGDALALGSPVTLDLNAIGNVVGMHGAKDKIVPTSKRTGVKSGSIEAERPETKIDPGLIF